jgi:hypothetical protein
MLYTSLRFVALFLPWIGASLLLGWNHGLVVSWWID